MKGLINRREGISTPVSNERSFGESYWENQTNKWLVKEERKALGRMKGKQRMRKGTKDNKEININ